VVARQEAAIRERAITQLTFCGLGDKLERAGGESVRAASRSYWELARNPDERPETHPALTSRRPASILP